jgi:hypothetical protein
MRVIEFDGCGQPRIGGIASGDILLLVQGDEIGIVRLELLPPEKFGPVLEHATNMAELREQARLAVKEAFPKGLSRERDWVVECPLDLAARARFPLRGTSTHE